MKLEILKKYKNIRCLQCGSAKSPWDERCPICAEAETRHPLALKPYKRKVVLTYAGVVAAIAFIIFMIIFSIVRECTYQKYSKIAENNYKVERNEAAVRCYEIILERFPGCVRAQDRMTEILVEMANNGEISEEEGYTYFLKYSDYMTRENYDTLWDELIYYYGQ